MEIREIQEITRHNHRHVHKNCHAAIFLGHQQHHAKLYMYPIIMGVMISSDGSVEKEIEARTGNATRVIGGMSDAVLRRKELSRSTKLKVVNATVMPVLMYGCETWSLTKKQQSKVQATQMNVLGRIEGMNRLDRVRNVVIRERFNQGVLHLAKRRQESWKGRLEVMSIEKTTKKVFVEEMEGKRPRGRPRLR